MALNDVQHVEAVAIMRRLVDEPIGGDSQARIAARQWLAENHPEPSAYVAAMEHAAMEQNVQGSEDR